MMRRRNYLYFLLWFFLYLEAKGTLGCEGKTFGANCKFLCHCHNGAKCNETTGYCPDAGKCASGWSGEYCHLGNSAVNKNAQQSSDYRQNQFKAPQAVDGNTIQNPLTQCTHTVGNGGENQPWWMVDLEEAFTLFTVRLYNRGKNDNCWTNQDPSCRERLKNLKIFLTNTTDPNPENGQLCRYYEPIIELGTSPVIPCREPVVGRYLYVKLMSTQTVLTLCEVVLVAYQYNECQAGRYGLNCNYKCRCANDAGCDAITGHCPEGCDQRHTGRYCNIEIPNFVTTTDIPTQTTIGIEWPPGKVDFNVPDSGQVTAYRLQHKPSSAAWNWKTTEILVAYSLRTGSMYHVNVTGLFAFTEYRFRLLVEYEVNGTKTWGQEGTESVLRTACGAPLIGPTIRNMTSGIDNRTIITIQQIPDHQLQCERVTRYTIYYKITGVLMAIWNVTDTENTTAIIFGLPVGVNVTFIVAVSNNGGYLTNGTMEYYVIPQVPSPVQGTVTGVPVIPIAAGCSVAVLAIVAVTVILVLLRRRRQKADKQQEPRAEANAASLSSIALEFKAVDLSNGNVTRSVELLLPDSSHNEVIHDEIYENAAFDVTEVEHEMAVKDLLQIVKNKKLDDRVVLQQEFKKFPENLTKPYTVAAIADNKRKNRFKNIVPYDHNRVVLSPQEGIENSDYINASYIDGYDKKKKFIAAQGPIPVTISDFWRLIWQESCPVLAMVTCFVEGGKTKCTEYFSTKVNQKQTFGALEITLLETRHLPHFSISTLRLQKGEESRIVKHHHFTTWPDHGTPKFASSMVEFWRRVTADGRKKEGPILVHCSAGVGRTGTFLAIDYLFHQGEALGKVNVHKCIMELRSARTNMVQVVDQYSFIHDALVEYFCVGKTAILCSNLANNYKTLTKQDGPGEKSGLMKQYELLSMFDTIHPEEEYADGRSQENVKKNRTTTILPDKMSIARLSVPIDGKNDYINAVFVDGFTKKNAFVVTQFPLADTVVDFWRLVFDYSLSTIVTIGKVPAEEKEFWPTKETQLNFGILTIELTRTDSSYPEYTVRNFKLSRRTKTGEPVTRKVRQYHFPSWPASSAVPKDPSCLVNLISTVQTQQQNTGSDTVLVHCLDGASQSGVFCTTYCAIEKVKLEQEVDIFEQARLVRVNRPQFLQSFEQYSFVHEVLLAYLEGFDTYANYL